MGRQASALCHWQDQRSPVTALLESTEIILRGAIRAHIPRADLSAISAQDGTLSLQAGAGQLRLELGQAEAEKWAASLAKPPPTLAQKLGVSIEARAFVIGAVTDAELASALAGLITSAKAEAAYLIAEIHAAPDLARVLIALQSGEPAPLWLIHEKGRMAALKDSEIRSTMRARSYIDTKSTAVSAQMTATLYRPRGLHK